MSKRLQVLMDDAELREIQKVARRDRVSVAEWVRRALRQARRQMPERSTDRKHDAIAAALEHEFPTADVDAMNAEIERGYGDAAPR